VLNAIKRIIRLLYIQTIQTTSSHDNHLYMSISKHKSIHIKLIFNQNQFSQTQFYQNQLSTSPIQTHTKMNIKKTQDTKLTKKIKFHV